MIAQLIYRLPPLLVEAQFKKRRFFTRLADFRTIQEKQAYWITRMANIYHIEVEHVYELPRRSEQIHEGWLLQFDSRILIGTSRSGGPLRVRQVVWLHPQTGDIWTLFTNQFDWKPKRTLKAYLARWGNRCYSLVFSVLGQSAVSLMGHLRVVF